MIVNKFPMVTGGNIYGAEWNGTSTTAWTRTDKAVGFPDPNPYVSGASTYGSPFDNIYPWSDMVRVTDANAGEMVKIPKFWYTLTQTNGGGMKIQIADKAMSGFSVCPACMDRGDGNGERDYILVGRYHCASTYKSTSGVTPLSTYPRDSFRTGIQNLGTGIYMMDWATRFTILLLYLVEFADWNSQAKIGYGCGYYSESNMGYTDSMPYHTGTTQSSRTTYGLGTQYRYIEGLWDNLYDWIDGCRYTYGGLYIIKNPANFSDDSRGINVGKPSSGYPSAFSVKNVSGSFPLFIPTANSGSTSTYSCDSWLFNGKTYPCMKAGGYYMPDQNSGLFCFNYGAPSQSSSSDGSRPMKLP